MMLSLRMAPEFYAEAQAIVDRARLELEQLAARSLVVENATMVPDDLVEEEKPL